MPGGFYEGFVSSTLPTESTWLLRARPVTDSVRIVLRRTARKLADIAAYQLMPPGTHPHHQQRGFTVAGGAFPGSFCTIAQQKFCPERRLQQQKRLQQVSIAFLAFESRCQTSLLLHQSEVSTTAHSATLVSPFFRQRVQLSVTGPEQSILFTLGQRDKTQHLNNHRWMPVRSA